MEKQGIKIVISFIFDEIITCGAVLSGFELCEAIRELGHECYIVSPYNNKELENYFNIKPIREPKGITITFTPKKIGDYAYIRTQDGRWLNHQEKKISVSEYIDNWIGGDIIISNGTHKRFTNKNLKRDIDCLIEGNYESNKNIEQTIKEAKKYGEVVWFGRQTKDTGGIKNISNPSLEEIVTLYNRTKVFIKMSKVEGWNRPIAEATACGVPQVINNSGGNKEIKITSWTKIANKLLKYLYENEQKRFL